MSSLLRALLVAGLLLLVQLPASAADPAAPEAANALQVLEQFNRPQQQRAAEAAAAEQHGRQVIMFSIGAVLLVLLLSTASVGIAVAVYGKPLFVVHMVLAGLTVTMAIVHVIVGMVWFYPF